MKKTFIILSVLFSLSACAVEFEPNENSTQGTTEFPIDIKITDQNNVIEFSDWHEVTQGLEIKEEIITGDIEEKITFVKIDPNYIEFKIEQDVDEPKTVSQWQQQNNALMVSNAGYFQENFNTAGLLIVDGQIYGPKKSSTYTGMLLIEAGFPQLRYLPVSSYDFDTEQIDYGVQSFPTLIKPPGLANIEDDNGKISRRTVIAKDFNENYYLIYSHNYNITLYQLMDYLLNYDIKFKIVINLDGGSSTGVAINHDEFSYSISSVQVPNVIVLNKK